MCQQSLTEIWSLLLTKIFVFARHAIDRSSPAPGVLHYWMTRIPMLTKDGGITMRIYDRRLVVPPSTHEGERGVYFFHMVRFHDTHTCQFLSAEVAPGYATAEAFRKTSVR